MFERESTLNAFLLSGLRRIAEDIPAERLNERAPGNGHPPLWVLGHLAACAEMGLQIFGEQPQHPAWLKAFGPGSSDEIPDASPYSRDELLNVCLTQYPQFCEMAQAADSERMNQPHAIGLLKNSAIRTVGDVVAHLLTSHFAFHLAQLSCWRRAAGHGPLF